MRISFLALGAVLTVQALVLSACNPTFNWRDVRPDGSRLALLMPCKPDKAQKAVSMVGQATDLMVLSCDAGGATFGVAIADVKDAARATAALAQWQSATLSNMKAVANTPAAAIKLAGLTSTGVMVKATGQRANGQAVSSQAAYFAQDATVFQVVMYANTIAPDVAETFFSGLKFE